MSRRVIRACAVAVAAAAVAAAPAHAIYSGAPVAPADAPWSVAFIEKGELVCSGALVAPDRVLTAAHCVSGETPRQLRLRLGGGRWQDGRPLRWVGAQVPRSYHESPSGATKDDIAVLRLAQPVTGVPLLPLARKPPTPGELATTVGRGRTGPYPASAKDPDPGDTTDAPLSATQRVEPAATCERAYGRARFDPRRDLCTSDRSAAHAQSCGGDSGGPVMVNGAEVGVVTWGAEVRGGDCGAHLPDVSELVSAHLRVITGPLRRVTAHP